MKNAGWRVVILFALIALFSIKSTATSYEQVESYNQIPSNRQMNVSDGDDRPGYTIITTSEIESTSTK